MTKAQKQTGIKFEPQGYNDTGFAVAFLVQLAAVVVWIGYAAAAGKFSAPTKSSAAALLQGIQSGVVTKPSPEDSVNYFLILAFVTLSVAIVFSAVWMLLLKTFPVEMVKVSLITFPVAFLVLGLVLVATGGSPLMPLLMAALFGFFVWCVWDRVDFTARILKVVVEIYDKSPQVYLVAIGTIVLQAVWMVIWILALVPAMAGDSNGLVFFALVLSLYWGIQVISNILYVTVAGVVARYYFGQQQAEATKRAFGQACTTMFGSICFGSLLIAIVQTLREMARAAQEQARKDNNAAMAILACCCDCFLGVLENLVRLFNEFAFVYVAIYAIPFSDAASKTYDLLTTSDAIMKDNIAGIVTICGCFAVAIACAAFNGFAAWQTQLSQGFVVGAVFLGFFLGFAIMCVVSRIVEGGVSTMIVCFEEEPNKLDDSLKSDFSERKRVGRR